MSERTMLDKIRDLAIAEAANGTAIIGLWVNWNGYRHLPPRFTQELNRLPPSSPRRDVAAILNEAWGGHGIATVIHRETQVRPDLAADRTAWLGNELATRIAASEFPRFAESLAANGPRHGHAVIVLADQSFTNDGQSPLDWHHGSQALTTRILNPDVVLPSGLSLLVEYDTEMQYCISQLELNLVERWRLHEAKDSSGAKQSLDELCRVVSKRHDPATLRTLAGLPQASPRSTQFTPDECMLLKQRIRDHLSTRSTVTETKRLAFFNDGLLNWFLPRDGSVTLSDGRLLRRCFREPLTSSLSPDSWAVALMNNASAEERKEMKKDPGLRVAVVTLMSLYCAMRFANMFAHRGEYEFDLPAHTIEAVLANETRNLERVAYAWRP